jgi:hypothetical protein
MPTNRIAAMYRTGDRRTWVLLLACGHKVVATNQDTKDKQLFAGKPYACPECKTEDTP